MNTDVRRMFEYFVWLLIRRPHRVTRDLSLIVVEIESNDNIASPPSSFTVHYLV
jgi:hypothetical protein